MSNRGRHKNPLRKLIRYIKSNKHVCRSVYFYKKDKLTERDTITRKSYIDFTDISKEQLQIWFNELKNVHNYTKIIIRGTPEFTFIL